MNTTKLNTAFTNFLAVETEARDFGFVWPDVDTIINQAISECHEIKDAIIAGEPQDRIQEEIGDLLHVIISLCIFCGYDLDIALNKITKKFGSRLKALKQVTKEHNLDTLQGQSLEFMLNLWDQAKKIVR